MVCVRSEGHILDIKYFLPNSIDPPFKLAIDFNLICNLVILEHNSGSGNTAEIATQGDTAFSRHFPAKINSQIPCEVPLLPFLQDGFAHTAELVANNLNQIIRRSPRFQTLELRHLLTVFLYLLY